MVVVRLWLDLVLDDRADAVLSSSTNRTRLVEYTFRRDARANRPQWALRSFSHPSTPVIHERHTDQKVHLAQWPLARSHTPDRPLGSRQACLVCLQECRLDSRAVCPLVCLLQGMSILLCFSPVSQPYEPACVCSKWTMPLHRLSVSGMAVFIVVPPPIRGGSDLWDFYETVADI